MNQQSLNTRICEAARTRAEQELAAFFAAMTEMFGSEQAELAAEDWLHHLLAMDHLPASVREWRQLSVKASSRFATRVKAEVARPLDPRSHSNEVLCATW
jgi:hypothetical protein